MFLSNRNLPPKNTHVRIVIPVRCAVTIAAMHVCAQKGADAAKF